LEARFETGFALEAGPAFFVFELVAFFDFLRAAIANLSTREHFRIHLDAVHEYYSKFVHQTALQNGNLSFLPTKTRVSSLSTPSDSRSTINLSFSTNSSKNQRRR
jgi:hypothetical protein